MMLRKFKYLFVILICHIFSISASGQSGCPDEFNRIGPQCIGQRKLNYQNKPIPLTTGLENNVYFYKTPSGELGKFKVIGTVVNKLECTILIDAVTYGGEKTFTPNTSLSVSVANSHWLKSRIFLDKEGLSAIELIKTNNKQDQDKTNDEKPDACLLVFTKGVEVSLHKKDLPKAREENLMLFYTPLVLVFIAIFLVVRLFMEEQEKFKTSEALEEAENTNKNNNEQLFLKITKPFYKRYFLPMVQGFKNKQEIRAKYKQKLANAGLTKDMSPEEFMALKIFMILGGPFVFLTVRWIMEETWPLGITPIMGVVGYYYPNIWLDGLIANRSAQILRAMPFIIDMLALSVEAGLDFMAAIQRVIEKAPPSPLVEEFEVLIKETKIGSSRADGLRQLGWRINIIEINSFCATLIAADSVGASIGPILKQLSNELRVKRSSRAEQQGATAATKILIPMIFFILPAVLVAIFAPMVLKMMTGKL